MKSETKKEDPVILHDEEVGHDPKWVVNQVAAMLIDIAKKHKFGMFFYAVQESGPPELMGEHIAEPSRACIAMQDMKAHWVYMMGADLAKREGVKEVVEAGMRGDDHGIYRKGEAAKKEEAALPPEPTTVH